MKQTKRHYYILLHDEYVGQTWAVSEEKAKVNWWWKYAKDRDRFSERRFEPYELEAICVH